MPSSDRNTVTTEDGVFRQVTDFSVLADFDCGDDDLNEFARQDAETHRIERIAETYSFCLPELPDVPIAFASLLNDSISLRTTKQRKLVPNRVRVYPEYPAVKIGRLGVHVDYQRMAVGCQLIDIIKELFTNNNRTGCRFITVDAYNNERVIAFYLKNKFDVFPVPESKEERPTKLLFFDLSRFKGSP